jgi:exopolyphosphatase/guanosine-5'-triphosphate,3'-diphosphate pyrophosphatase
VGWDEAVGSSGSAKALVDILELNGLSDGGITRSGLERLRNLMLKAGSLDNLHLEGLRPDRLPVLTGGFAIMWAVFQEFGLERMTFSEGALRLGVLYDLLGRYHHHDLRDATVSAFVERYGVDLAHAREVAETARAFLLQLDPSAADDESTDRRFLEWAAMLHEVGVSVAHSSYHKHSAYILGNADMPGFSRMDQGRLARMVLAHRGKLSRLGPLDPESQEWRLILCLRLSAVVHRARDGRGVPPLRLKREGRGFVIVADAEWLRNLPLTAAALDEEERQWQTIGLPVKMRVERSAPRSPAGT